MLAIVDRDDSEPALTHDVHCDRAIDRRESNCIADDVLDRTAQEIVIAFRAQYAFRSQRDIFLCSAGFQLRVFDNLCDQRAEIDVFAFSQRLHCAQLR